MSQGRWIIAVAHNPSCLELPSSRAASPSRRPSGPRTAKPLVDSISAMLTDAYIARLTSSEKAAEWADKANAAGKAQVRACVCVCMCVVW